MPSKFDAIIEAADDSSGSLTVGIELEVLIPTLLSEQAFDPHPFEHGAIYKGKRQGQEQVQAAVKETPWNELDEEEEDAFDEEEEDEFDEWLVNFLQHMMPGEKVRAEPYDTLYLPPGNIPRYDAWRLTRDASIWYNEPEPEHERGYQWLGREITSEILDSSNFTYCMERVILICTSLRKLRVHLNDSTSVHVHVGRGDEAFSLVTLKKFTTLLWLTDEAILKLHGVRQSNEYCRPVRVESELALKSLAKLQAENATNPAVEQRQTEAQIHEFLSADLWEQDDLLPAQIRRIWGAQSVEEIAGLMTCEDRVGGRGSVGFRRFLPAGADNTGGNTHTLKWRQMAGCLAPFSIIHWMRFCLSFTNFARLSDSATFKTMIVAIQMKEGRFTALDLLEALGLEFLCAHFEKQMRDEGEEEGELFLKPLDMM